MGGLAAVIFGFTFSGLPFALLMPLSLLAGALTGAFYAGIAGYLSAATGAHEVISTIMLNLISYRLLDYMLSLEWVQREGRSDPCLGRCRPMPNCRGCSNGSTPTCACMPASS
jgi:ABC-type uncharacterized transport system permease subunit